MSLNIHRCQTKTLETCQLIPNLDTLNLFINEHFTFSIHHSSPHRCLHCLLLLLLLLLLLPLLTGCLRHSRSFLLTAYSTVSVVVVVIVDWLSSLTVVLAIHFAVVVVVVCQLLLFFGCYCCHCHLHWSCRPCYFVSCSRCFHRPCVFLTVLLLLLCTRWPRYILFLVLYICKM